MPAICAVLFDYGLVLTAPPDPSAWRRMQSVLDVADPAFHNAYWRHRVRYDLGELTGPRYWQAVSSDVARNPTADEIAALIEADVEVWTQPNQPMIDWVAALQRDGVLTGILSNMPDAMEFGIMARIPWMSSFPQRIFSHRLGIAKPDERIYRAALSALSTAPHETLFLDDRIENIEAARAIGMQAIHYSSYEGFLEEFQTAGFTGLTAPSRSL